MFFPLVPNRLSKPIPTAGAPLYRDMPVVPLIVSHGEATDRGLAYVDTMADVVLLPDRVAANLGIDLSAAPSQLFTVVGGAQVLVRFAEVELELRNPLGGVKWHATVGFGPTQRWLFGHFGGLEFFHFTLDAANEEMILAPRETLPVAP